MKTDEIYKLKENYFETHPGLTPIRYSFIKIEEIEKTEYGLMRPFKIFNPKTEKFTAPEYPYTHLSEKMIDEDYEFYK